MHLIVFLIIIIFCSCKTNSENSNEESENTTKRQVTRESLSDLLSESAKPEENESEVDQSHTSQYSIRSKEIKAEEQCEKCNIDEIWIADENMSNISYQEIFDVICTINEECEDNIEFSEYSNNVLHSILEHYTEDFLLICISNESILTDYHYVMLSNPLKYYDYNEVLKQVRDFEAESYVKEDILNALEKIR